MHEYFAYGLGVHSEVDVPEFLPANHPAEVTIRVEPSGREHRLSGEREMVAGHGNIRCFHVSPEEVVFAFADLATFRILGGREVLVSPGPDADQRLIELLLSGVVMAVVGYQRGSVALHGSAVAVGEGAVVFLGHCGRGKSTAAAALRAGGHPLLADDVSLIFRNDGLFQVAPGIPQLKVNAEVVEQLGRDAHTLPQIHPLIPKRAWRDVDSFVTAPVPVRRVYVLEEGPEVSLAPIAGPRAAIDLITFSYKLEIFKAAVNASAYLRECAALVAQAPVRRLFRNAQLWELARMTDLVEQDAGIPALRPASGAAVPVSR